MAGDDLDVTEAVATIEEGIRHQGGLRSRTEGLTWAIWGLVGAPFILAWDAVVGLIGGELPGSTFYLWIPWAAMGSVATYALWRSAALAEPALEDEGPAGPAVTAGWLAYVAVAFGVVLVLPIDVWPDHLIVLVLGAGWVLFALVDPVGLTATGYRTCLGIGAAMLAVGVGLGGLLWALGPLGVTGMNQLATAAALVAVSGVPFVAGIWQALRG